MTEMIENKMSWSIVELNKVAEVNMGQSPPSSTYNVEGKGWPFFQGKAEFTQLHPVIKKWCTQPKKTAKKGDILISVRAPVGSTNIANVDCAIGRGLAAISYHPCIDYLWYYLKNIERSLDDQGTGTTFKAISGKVLKSQKLPIPPLPEQRAIVSKIEQLFSELDNGIANLKAAKAKLETYRQAVLKKAFEGELTKEWRKNQIGHLNLAAEPLAEYNQVEQSQTKKVGNNDLPEGWDWVKLGEVGDVSGGLTKNSGRNKLQKSIPYLRVANVYADRLDLTEIKTIGILEKELARVLLERNDLLVVEGNGSPNQIGRVALWNGAIDPCVHQNHLIKVRLHETCFPKFVLHWLLSPVGRENIKSVASSTSGLYTLNLSKVKSLVLPFCSEDEQTKIVHEIETRLSVCDKLSESIDQSLEQATALRQSILKKAFAGELLSNEELAACQKEPDWEPAEVLVERIGNQKVS